MTIEVTVRVPAKVNLHLGVGPRRADGYHELITIFHAVDLYDTVSVRPAARMGISVRGAGAVEVPVDGRNLAWRAAELYARHRGGPAAFTVTIDKQIPVAGGMAGGSADAAAVLTACAALTGDTAPLDDLAAELGSDVAFGLYGGTALGTGRGEQVVPLAAGHTLHWAFAFAGFGIAAREAYREFDRLCGHDSPAARRPQALLAALAGADVTAIATHLHNDLQQAALTLHPRLQGTLDAGTDAGALAGIVSGSGPTCAFLCTDAAAAARVAAAVAPLCRGTVTASGPAPGAGLA